jgi:hypothetical protein
MSEQKVASRDSPQDRAVRKEPVAQSSDLSPDEKAGTGFETVHDEELEAQLRAEEARAVAAGDEQCAQDVPSDEAQDSGDPAEDNSDEAEAEAEQAPAGLYKRLAAWLVEHRGTPHTIALGFAIGIFVALTPTVGIQMILGATIAHVFRANRVIAAAMAWITNPLTIVPIYYFNYRVGLLFMSGDASRGRAFIRALSDISLFDPHSIVIGFRLMAQEFAGIAGVLWVGSLVVATVGGVISYPLVRRIVEVERALKERRKKHRAERLARRARIRALRAEKRARRLKRKAKATKRNAPSKQSSATSAKRSGS